MSMDERLKGAFQRTDAHLLDQYKSVCLTQQALADDMNPRRKLLMKEAREAGDTKLHQLMRELVPPPYFAVTLCRFEGELGLSNYGAGLGKRWACKTCWNFAAPVWSTNEKKCPSLDEAIHEYTRWESKILKQSNSTFTPWRETMNRRMT